MVHFRKLVPEDRELLDLMIDKDADHKGKIASDFFLAAPEQSIVLAVEDKAGTAMFLRFDLEPETKTARTHIQFREDEEHRTGKALYKGFPWAAKLLYGIGVRRMIFDTINPRLASFCERLWGFKRIEGSDDYELFLTGAD